MSEKAIRKRNKPTFVCTNCRRRKIRCDRKTPCSSCVKLNIGYTCVYDTSWKGGPDNRNNSNTGSDRLSITIQELEELEYLRARVSELENIFTQREHKNEEVSIENITKPYLRIQPIPPPQTPITANPVVNSEDMLNFYTGYTPLYTKSNIRRVNFGPLSWVSLSKRDPVLSLSWKEISNEGSFPSVNLTQLPLTPENIAILNTYMTTSEGTSSNMDKFFRRKYLEVEGYDETVPYNSSVKVGSNPANSESSQNKPTDFKMSFTSVSLARTIFEGKINPELQLIQKIKAIVPNKKVFWNLIDLFFENVYPFFPFIDEDSFRKDLQKIFGKVDYEDKPFSKVNICKKLDLAIVALSFICLRMTYLSLYSNLDAVNREVVESEEMTTTKFLFLHPINSSCIDVANSCIQCFQFTRKSNLIVFQALLFMRFYKEIAPEENEGIDGGDSQVGTALIIQMAYSLGLNREPNLLDVCNDEKTNHLGRKIWAALILADFKHCLAIGNPISIHSKNYDVSRPFLKNENSNIKDVDMESAVVEMFSWMDPERQLIRRLLGYVLDMRDGIEINSITNDLHVLEKVMDTQYNVLQKHRLKEEIFNSNHIRFQVKKFLFTEKARKFLETKVAITSFYYHIYLHYEKKMDTELSFFYLTKIVLIVVNDVMPYIDDIANGFLSSMGWFLNPSVQLTLLKSNQILYSSFARIKALIHQSETSKEHSHKLASNEKYRTHFTKLMNLSEDIKRTIRLKTQLLERMASRYYCAWRISKSQVTFLNVLTGNEFYDKHYQQLKRIKGFQFTSSQLDQFASLIEKLKKILLKTLSPDHGGSLGFPEPDKEKMCATQTPVVEQMLANSNQERINEVSDSLRTGLTPLAYLNDAVPPDLANENFSCIDHMWLSHAAMKQDAEQSLEDNLFSAFFPTEHFSSSASGTKGELDTGGSISNSSVEPSGSYMANPPEQNPIQLSSSSSSSLLLSSSREVRDPTLSSSGQMSQGTLVLPSLFKKSKEQDGIDQMLDDEHPYSFHPFS
ncbi:CTA4 [Candida metapsilosis]|uniref:CTA4 n=1 Tax=Candida metapsilosis TaxID=273372 RepID=A0A8H7ZCG8_9ASCO|nr:CTA4 [Candida metapsilosis]